MAIYLDSANLEEARQVKELGWVYGVTTNPSPMARTRMPPEVTLKALAQLNLHQVFYQLVSPDMANMLVEACEAMGFVKHGLILKIPPTENGFRFVAHHGDKFPCCVTAIFDPAQALVAREAVHDTLPCTSTVPRRNWGWAGAGQALRASPGADGNPAASLKSRRSMDAFVRPSISRSRTIFV
jgi:transaldolase